MKNLIYVLSIALLTGCATIMHGSTQEVGISSSPSDAKVTINGQNEGQTPLIADLKRKDNHTVRIYLDGYQPYETTLTRKTSGWVWGNLVFGGIPGLAVDAITGGLYKLTPEQIDRQLSQEIAQAGGADQMFITVVLQPDPSWQKVGQLQKN